MNNEGQILHSRMKGQIQLLSTLAAMVTVLSGKDRKCSSRKTRRPRKSISLGTWASGDKQGSKAAAIGDSQGKQY